HILIKGARTHNLKNVTLEIPRNQLVVITGLSGSGKSSLAFDTLYAEGQRRYVESLSAYARQFLGKLQKPEVDFIKGLPPAIAIQQKVSTRNARSTVGTVTEIYDYLKLLFARIGKTYSPISGKEVKRYQAEDIVSHIMKLPIGLRLMLLFPLKTTQESSLSEQLLLLQAQGFNRILIDGKDMRINELIDEPACAVSGKIHVVVDRITTDGQPSTANRLTDSVETALFEGKGTCSICIIHEDGNREEQHFSTHFQADGMQFTLPSQHLFNFNNPLGACPQCEGYGKIIGIDPDLVVPDKNLSIYEEAIACWRGEKMGLWNKELIANAEKFDFPIHKPFYLLTQEQKDLIWRGNEYFRGLNRFFEMLEEKQYAKIQYRVLLSRYRGKTKCPLCDGKRLKQEAYYVRVGDKNIGEIIEMSVRDLLAWFDSLSLSEHEHNIADRLILEITNRLHFLDEVGLNYLTLNRPSNTLSGGESQRIHLATSLGSSLVGSLYILDEPSIGLHPRDTQRLIGVLKQLRDMGNTVVVVEHDEQIIKSADYLIDIGPEAGRNGGEVLFATPLNQIDYLSETEKQTSHTWAYLTGKEHLDTPEFYRKWNNYIQIDGATENNLKNLSIKFPLNIMSVVTGVSGSGKSTLIKQILYPALKKHYGGTAQAGGSFSKLSGSLHLLNDVELIDQNPIGKSSRSNPVTYLKAYDEIRKLFAEQQLSKQMGYTAAHFSFNTPGGRCEECQGEGTITVEMQFMADLVLECEHCHGKRFKSDTLEVLYQGKNIHDILEMTVNQAIEFFSQQNGNTERKIVKRLLPLQEVGIGYIKLGQSSSTLSGGESQRVKLAAFLAMEKQTPTLFLFDEPTTGLHTHDIKTLMKAINALIHKGHTVIIIEHNIDVIRQADHIIDLGPEGGEEGGNIIFEGTPQELKQLKQSASHTAKFI
ncbi:MAG: excinuclease ABC subunit UvrA, partial [Paludibacteraceae bacterium]|nr:excinuclease ABC subunit UvrA [Paludibacteraceae bacterium]